MFHVEVRQFPHSARAFNLERPELDDLLRGWAAESTVRWGEREWEPRKAKLTILEGPALDLPEIGMGRGWPEAQRRSRDVTVALLSAGAGADRRAEVLERCAGAPVSLAGLRTALGGDPAALDRAVWALVVAGELELVRRPGR